MPVAESPNELQGDVNGPTGPVVDNRLVRMHLTSGKIIQSSGVGLDDNDDITGLRNVTVDSGSFYGLGSGLERFEFDGPGDRIILRNATLAGESGGQLFTYSKTMPGVIYVSTNGHDSFDGLNQDRPKLTIAGALAAWTDERIELAPGTYVEDIAMIHGATLEAEIYGAVTITGNHTFTDSTGGTKSFAAKGITFGSAVSGTDLFTFSGTSAKNLTLTECDLSTSGNAECFFYSGGHGGGTVRCEGGSLTSASGTVMIIPTDVNLYVDGAPVFTISGDAFDLTGGRLYVFGDKQVQIFGSIHFNAATTSRCQLVDAIFGRIETNINMEGNADSSSGYYETFVTAATDYNTKPTVGGANANEFGELSTAERGSYWRYENDGSASPKWAAIRNNFWATAAPTVNDDVDLEYGIGSWWWDGTGRELYIARDVTDGAAAYDRLLNATTGGALGGDLDMDQNDIVEVGTIHGGALVSDTLRVGAHTAAMVDPDGDGKIIFEDFLTFNGITDFTATADANFQAIEWSATLDCTGQGIVVPQGLWWAPTIQIDTAQSFGGAATFQDSSAWHETAAITGSHAVFDVGSYLGGVRYVVQHAGAGKPPSTIYGSNCNPGADAGLGTLTVPLVIAYQTNAPLALKSFLNGEEFRNGAVCTEYVHFKANSGNANALMLEGGSTITTEIGLDLANISQGATAISIRSDAAGAYMTHMGPVGIGLDTPLVKLHVRSTKNLATGAANAVLEDDTAQSTANVGGMLSLNGKYTDAGAYTTFAGIAAHKENTTSGQFGAHMAFYTRINGEGAWGATSPKMMIMADGGVGIGTTTVPHGGVGAAKLAIEGTNASTAGPHVQFTTASDDYPLMQMQMYSHDFVYLKFDSYWDGGDRSSDTGSNFQIGKETDLLTFKAASGVALGAGITWTEAFRIEADAEIMHSPGAALKTYWRDVNTSIASLTANQLDLSATAAVRIRAPEMWMVDNVDPRFVLGDGATAGLFGFIGWDTTGDYIHIGTNAGSDDVLIVAENDTVGVGISVPASRFSVKQSANSFNGGITLVKADSAVDWEIVMDASADLYISYNELSPPNLFLKNNGNVGIGTVTPDGNLDVEGASNTIAVCQTTAVGANYAGWQAKSGAGTWGIYTGAAGHGTIAGDLGFFDADAAAYRVVFKDDGKVGIGLTSPVYQLHIHEPTSAAVWLMFSNSTTGGTAGNGLLVGMDGNEDGLMWHYEAEDLIFGTSNLERMRITSAGLVGIGMTPGTAALEVKSVATYADQHGTVKAVDGADDTQYVYMGYDNTADVGFIQAVDNLAAWKNLSLQGAGGAVGIGTTAPARPLHLHVAGAGGVSLMMFSNGDTGIANTDGFQIGINSNEEAVINQRENQPILFYTNAGNERMRITAAGEVSILSDSTGLVLGAGSDAKLYYDGTDLIVEPNLVGSGMVRFAGHTVRDDNFKAFFGSGDDAEIYYDGNDLIINPDAVGSGRVGFAGHTWHPDNTYAYFGNANDASIYYDGTNLVIDPDLVGSGEVKVAGSGVNVFDKTRFHYDSSTGEYGWQIKLTNNTGSNSVKGELVEADTTDDMSFKQAGGDSLEVIGVVYEAGVADASEVWLWTGQGSVCQVLIKDGTTATRGYWAASSDTAGRADLTNASAPGAVLAHFQEIGHVLESVGSGTDVLARILFHTL